MDSLRDEISPYRHFERNAWAKLRADTPMTLDQADIDELRGLNDRIDLAEVVAIYLPLSRLLNLYVAATQELFRATDQLPACRGHQGALYHRHGRQCRRRQEHHRAHICSGFWRAGRTIPRSIS